MELMAELMHYTRYATPDGKSNVEAFTDWLINLIITDDDNGDLSDLTPHFYEIIEAFNNHNITLAMYIPNNYIHSPLQNTKDSANAYPVSLTIPFVNNVMPVNDV